MNGFDRLTANSIIQKLDLNSFSLKEAKAYAKRVLRFESSARSKAAFIRDLAKAAGHYQ